MFGQMCRLRAQSVAISVLRIPICIFASLSLLVADIATQSPPWSVRHSQGLLKASGHFAEQQLAVGSWHY